MDPSVRRSGGKLTTNGVSERRFVLAANKRASGCAAKFTLRGAMLAAEALPTGVIIIRVNGHETTFTPKEISWLVTVDSFLSKREQTEVVIIAKLSSDRMSDNELVEIDSLDIELDKCWRK